MKGTQELNDSPVSLPVNITSTSRLIVLNHQLHALLLRQGSGEGAASRQQSGCQGSCLAMQLEVHAAKLTHIQAAPMPT